jgi:hypothetical protein
MTLSKENFTTQSFELLRNGHLPSKIITECANNSSINWPARGYEDRIKKGIQDIRQMEGKDLGQEINPPNAASWGNGVMPGTKNSVDGLNPGTIKSAITRAKTEREMGKGFRTCEILNEIAVKFLHVTGTIYTNAIHVKEGDRWYSQDEEDEALGSEMGSLESFILGTSTWINLVDDKEKRHNITQEVLAIFRRNKPTVATRVAIMMYAMDVSEYIGTTSWTERDLTTTARTYALLEVGPGQVLMRNSDMEGLKYSSTHHNVERLAILVIENDKAPGIDARAMKEDLDQKGVRIEGQSMGLSGHGGKDEEEAYYITHRKVSSHMWPAFMWLVRSPGLLITESNDNSPARGNYITSHKALQEHDPILGQLGIHPPKIATHLVNLGVPKASIDPDRLKLISKIIFDASLQAYMRYESWKRRKKYGLG